jgi:hypothetical protein
MSLKTLPLTIPAGHSMSSGVDCSGSTRILRIVMPSDWTAAPLTFQTSVDGVTYNNLHLSTPTGDFSTYPATVPYVTPGSAITMPPNTGYGISWLRFRSGTFTTQIKQDADRTFQVVLDMPDAGTGGAGSAGPAGPTGPTGPTGTGSGTGAGGTGPQGDVGPTGPTGAQGATGTAGPTGLQGVPGPVGAAGPSGAVGIVGPQGPTGAQGSPGTTGPTGTASLKGATDGSDALAGNVGEFLAASNTAGVPLTSAVTANVVTLNLTPGDWQVSGVVVFTPNTTGPNAIIGGINTVSATLPTDVQVLAGACTLSQIWSSSMTSNKQQILPLAMCRINVAAATPVYLMAQSSFGGGSVVATGRIIARRMR